MRRQWWRFLRCSWFLGLLFGAVEVEVDSPGLALEHEAFVPPLPVVSGRVGGLCLEACGHVVRVDEQDEGVVFRSYASGLDEAVLPQDLDPLGPGAFVSGVAVEPALEQEIPIRAVDLNDPVAPVCSPKGRGPALTLCRLLMRFATRGTTRGVRAYPLLPSGSYTYDSDPGKCRSRSFFRFSFAFFPPMLMGFRQSKLRSAMALRKRGGVGLRLEARE